MCLIIFAHQADPRYSLIVAANRDEFFSRSTKDADFWPADNADTRILAGKDLVAGGTWLGLTTSGRFAAVTNIRDPSQQEQKPRSRGQLTLRFLAGNETPAKYCQSLSSQFNQYAGYNLLLGDQHEMFYVNNQEAEVRRLEPGVYGLSNGVLDSPWPKVERGRQQLQQLMSSDADLTTDQLLAMMANRSKAEDADLPDTGIPIELERRLSSAFIQNPEREYGTRCSTAIILSSNKLAAINCRFSEQNYDESGSSASAHYFHFDLKSP
jgi:uncharacterized protein with NRDE domain